MRLRPSKCPLRPSAAVDDPRLQPRDGLVLGGSRRRPQRRFELERRRLVGEPLRPAVCRCHASGRSSGLGHGRNARSSRPPGWRTLENGLFSSCQRRCREMFAPRTDREAREREKPRRTGLFGVRRRGLEPPPGYPGPGPQPGNPGVRYLPCVHSVQIVRESGRIGRNGRSGCCRGCCRGGCCLSELGPVSSWRSAVASGCGGWCGAVLRGCPGLSGSATVGSVT